MTIVQRHIEFDSGHRVARHASQCSHLHGHRYRLTVKVAGPIKNDNSPEHGMVIDFGRIKEALLAVHKLWDHRFIIGVDDPLKEQLIDLPGVVVIDRQPTAENLAALAYDYLTWLLAGLQVTEVAIQETASCEAVHNG